MKRILVQFLTAPLLALTPGIAKASPATEPARTPPANIKKAKPPTGMDPVRKGRVRNMAKAGVSILKGASVRIHGSKTVVSAKRYFQRKRARAGYPTINFE